MKGEAIFSSQVNASLAEAVATEFGLDPVSIQPESVVLTDDNGRFSIQWAVSMSISKKQAQAIVRRARHLRREQDQ